MATISIDFSSEKNEIYLYGEIIELKRHRFAPLLMSTESLFLLTMKSLLSYYQKSAQCLKNIVLPKHKLQHPNRYY